MIYLSRSASVGRSSISNIYHVGLGHTIIIYRFILIVSPGRRLVSQVQSEIGGDTVFLSPPPKWGIRPIVVTRVRIGSGDHRAPSIGPCVQCSSLLPNSSFPSTNALSLPPAPISRHQRPLRSFLRSFLLTLVPSAPSPSSVTPRRLRHPDVSSVPTALDAPPLT